MHQANVFSLVIQNCIQKLHTKFSLRQQQATEPALSKICQKKMASLHEFNSTKVELSVQDMLELSVSYMVEVESTASWCYNLVRLKPI